jgi:hypothetical protein
MWRLAPSELGQCMHAHIHTREERERERGREDGTDGRIGVSSIAITPRQGLEENEENKDNSSDSSSKDGSRTSDAQQGGREQAY